MPEGPLLAIGMDELRMNFTGLNILEDTGRNKLLRKVVSRIGRKRIEWIAGRLGIMTLVVEERTTSLIKFNVRKGLFSNLVYFKAGYYQSQEMVDESIANRIELNEDIRGQADKFLSPYSADKNDRYFVHVRRGDYTHWPSREAPAVMPLRWYMEQIECIRRINPKARFFIVSDDKPYVDEFFSGKADTVIVKLDVLGDFAVMIKCGGGGVLSASSYSWWASYFVRKNNPSAYFVAPAYWAGFRRNAWYPERIKTTWIQYEK